MKPKLVSEEKLQKLWIDWCHLNLLEPDKNPMRRAIFLTGARVALEELGVTCIQEVTPGRSCGFAAGASCNHPAWKGVARGLACDKKWCPLTKGASLVRAKEEKA